MTWNNDMSAAPKDGTGILAWAYREGWEAEGSCIVVCAWHGAWYIMGARGNPKHFADTKDVCTPTKWQHLPTPPQEPSNGQ